MSVTIYFKVYYTTFSLFKMIYKTTIRHLSVTAPIIIKIIGILKSVVQLTPRLMVA